MRITKIELKNFRAFYRPVEIDLHKTGKNLLVYGENGSGKSSLYLALKSFLESSEDTTPRFDPHQNIFIKDDGYIKLHLRANPRANEHVYEWSRTVNETKDQLIIDASRSKGFLDYKSLLETHYIHRESDTVEVFNLLVRNLLKNVISNATNRSIDEDWQSVLEARPSRRNARSKIKDLEEHLEIFNRELARRLEQLKTHTSEFLRKFGYDDDFVALNFDFEAVRYDKSKNSLEGDKIFLTVGFFNKDLHAHHRFLNEAKLSAIALSIYFAALRLQPESALKILALDDVLIGLDMSNRLPVLDILREYFSDYQIVLTTYDKAWYEIVKQRTTEKEWKYAESFFSKTDDCEIPIFVENKSYLQKARDFLDDNDYRACAIYLRTSFESILEKFCDKNNLCVRYCQNPKNLTSNDFWTPTKTGKKNDGSPFVTQAHVSDIELYRSIILNPLSHATIVNTHRKELEGAVKAVENLQDELDA